MTEAALKATNDDLAQRNGEYALLLKLADDVAEAFEAADTDARVAESGDFWVDGDTYLRLQQAAGKYRRARAKS